MRIIASKWLKRIALSIIWIVSLFYAYGFGAMAGKFQPQLAEPYMARAGKVLSLVSGRFPNCRDTDVLRCGFQDTTGRVTVDCSQYLGTRSAILMTFGQSNGANSGQDRYIPLADVANFNFRDGRCYKAEDPLLGAEGTGGSVWGVLADKLIGSGKYDKVLLLPFGVNSVPITQWQPGGLMHPIVKAAATAAQQQGITPTHVLWHQGEADAHFATPEADYFAMFEALLASLRAYGINAPVVPAVASHCGASAGQKGVRAAQMRLPTLDGVYAGPDTDTIQGELYRYDDCHFTAKGMQAHAELWLQALHGY